MPEKNVFKMEIGANMASGLYSIYVTYLTRDKYSLLLLYAVFLVLLGICWAFVMTSESTYLEVFLTLALPIAALVLFFFWQAMCVSYESGGGKVGWLKRTWRIFPSLTMVSIPLVIISLALLYVPFKYGLSGIYFIPMAAFLPLVAIHSWLEAARVGLFGAWKNSGQILKNTIEFSSLVIYATGLLGFAITPFLLMMVKLPLPGRWQIVWFVARLILAFAVAVVTWFVTIQSLRIKTLQLGK